MDNIWQLGLALGLAIDAGLALALALSGQGLHLANVGQYVSVAVPVAVICWAGLAPLVAAFQGAVSMFVRWDIWHNRNKVPPAAPVVVPVSADDDAGLAPDYLPAWRAEAHKFVTAGNLFGFKVRDIAAGEHEVIGWDEWGLMRDFLIEAGVLSPRGGTHWNDGWSWARWQREFATMPLPPASAPPPPVKLTPNAAQKQRQQQEKQRPEVVEGVHAD